MGASEADGLRGKWLRRAALAVLLRTGRPQTIGQVLHAVERLYGPVAGPAPNKLVADALGREVRRGGPGGSRHLRRRHDQPKFEMAAAQRAVRPTTLTRGRRPADPPPDGGRRLQSNACSSSASTPACPGAGTAWCPDRGRRRR